MIDLIAKLRKHAEIADKTGRPHCNLLHEAADRIAELERQLAEREADARSDFYRGVIAALGALCPHFKHGCTEHDEIVTSVGKAELYAAAEPEDVEWAGLDPEYYAAIKAQEGAS